MQDLIFFAIVVAGVEPKGGAAKCAKVCNKSWVILTYVLQNKTKRYKLADKTIDEELSFFIHVSQCRAILNYVGILFSVWSFQVQTEKEIISRLKGQICPFKYLLLGHTITTWTR